MREPQAIRILLRQALAFVAAAAMSLAAQAAPSYRNSPEVRQAMESLKTEDPEQLRLRWGDFAELPSGRQWLGTMYNNRATWRQASWVVPGAVMTYLVGFCNIKGECSQNEWMLQYNPATSRVDFYTTNDLNYMTGYVQPDGAVKVRFGFMSFETLRFDRTAQQVQIADYVPQDLVLRKTTNRELVQASRGAAGDPAQAAKEDKAAAAEAARRKEEQARVAAQAAEEARARQSVADAKAREELAAREARARQEQLAREAKLREEQEQKARAQAEAGAKRKAVAEAWSRQRDALAGRFPPIAVGETKTPVLAPSTGGKLRPAIHYLRNDQRAKLRVEVVSSSFAPLLAVYEVDKEAPLASADAASGAPARLSVNVTGDTAHYMIVVHSVDGKRGAYALKVERE